MIEVGETGRLDAMRVTKNFGKALQTKKNGRVGNFERGFKKRNFKKFVRKSRQFVSEWSLKGSIENFHPQQANKKVGARSAGRRLSAAQRRGACEQSEPQHFARRHSFQKVNGSKGCEGTCNTRTDVHLRWHNTPRKCLNLNRKMAFKFNFEIRFKSQKILHFEIRFKSQKILHLKREGASSQRRKIYESLYQN